MKKCWKSLTYEELKTKLCKTYDETYDDITGILRKRKIRAGDVIRETICHRLLLVEYFELKITDNQSNDFLGMLLKNDLSFS